MWEAAITADVQPLIDSLAEPRWWAETVKQRHVSVNLAAAILRSQLFRIAKFGT